MVARLLGQEHDGMLLAEDGWSVGVQTCSTRHFGLWGIAWNVPTTSATIAGTASQHKVHVPRHPMQASVSKQPTPHDLLSCSLQLDATLTIAVRG